MRASTSLAAATTASDNAVYAEVGYKLVGTRAIARVAKEMGVRTPVSRNPAMVLGGLKQGVTPLEMAKAYETLAEGGQVVSGSLASREGAPVTYTRVKGSGIDDENKTRRKRVISEGIAKQATQILSTVVTGGTGRAASIGEFAAGKTGTTENYQDAWFVGFTDDMTVAVWVGYPEGAKPMETEYRGEPVAGGTFPAEIWHDFMLSVKKIREVRSPQDKKDETPVPTVPTAPAPVEGVDDGETKPKRERTGKAKRAPERTPERACSRAHARARARAPAEPAPTPGGQPPTPPTGGGGTGGRRRRRHRASPSGNRAPRSRSASSTRSSCFLGETFGNAFTTFPFGPMMNVVRWTPQYLRPYIDFSTQTPYFSATLWSGSDRSMCGRSCLWPKRYSSLRRVARDADHDRAGGLVVGPALPDAARLRRAAGRVRLRKEIEHHGLPGEVRQPHELAARVGQPECRRPVVPPSSMPPFSEDKPSERPR